MKVGILTINGSDNYGNVLQNYAVQEILEELGVEAETIRNTTKYGRYFVRKRGICKWTPSYVKEYILSQLNYRYNVKNTGVGITRTICFYKKNIRRVEAAKEKRRKAFSSFEKTQIKWADKSIDINYPWTKEEVKEYNFYVSGSDQVWNPVYPSTSSINFLQFAPKEKRVALSPSFGINEIPDDLKEQYAQWLDEIPHLSVREEKGKKIIKELCGRNAEVLCDPTMVLPKEKWVKLEIKPEFLADEQYILTYFLGNRTKEYDKYINTIARRQNIRVINLFDVMDLEAYSVSPQEFIYLIHHANLVCTDSFHGAVFSILMNSDFVTFPRVENGNSMESRMITLLATFGLETRDYRNVKWEQLFKTDFGEVESVLGEKSKQFVHFLKTSLEGVASAMGIDKQNETLYGEKKKCCGCNACIMVCPAQCICMQYDEEGFAYPIVDESKCIHCNRCRQVCPVHNGRQQEDEFDKKCFVGYSKNAVIRKSSSSGGIFTMLAQAIIENNGSIFGASFDEEFNVEHQEARDLEQLRSLQGSKYVQSNIGSIYKRVRDVLEEGKPALFSGTPCQIKGLYSYLGKDYYNLLTQDIVCHGVPSPKVWREYMEAKKKKNIQSISFRDKTYGWHYFSMRINSGGKKYCKRLDEDWYLRLFLDNTILRPICYDCPMKKEGSCADITLADCWKSRSVTDKMLDTDEGLSLIIINNEKGAQVWQSVVESGTVCSVTVDKEKALSSQSAICSSVSPNPKRAMFFEAVNKVAFETLILNWYQCNIVSKMRKKLIYYKTKMKYFLSNLKRM